MIIKRKVKCKINEQRYSFFSSRAPIGYIVISENDITTNQGFKSIVCNEKIINNNYVYYYLKYNKEKIESIAN
ncbi:MULTISPECIES: restriction endonuclease subunit S [unclassified Clostridium]|uniref:restriction endonuclease subunit S n=1 Tax=unclassified Clostridium TaxID=2614128 RepID=UPI00345D6104